MDDSDESMIDWFDQPSPAESRVLVHGVTGFMDAGNAVRLAVEHILAHTESRILASFDIDLMFDYRGRRPRMEFMSDHFEDIELPFLNLIECVDERGEAFLLLHGQEPDTGWMTIVDSVVDLVEELNVTLTVGMNAVPFPAPHTRPVAVTAHATDPMLITGRKPWVGDMEIPASLGSFLELQLGREGHRAMGFAAHVPHYLANLDHPRSAQTLLTEMMSVTGLVLPLDLLREQADESDREVNAQIAGSSENQAVVASLEESFDALVADRGGLPTPNSVSGDDIAAQVEKFLAEMDARGREQE